MEKVAIGIDLGTTNSAIGVWYHERIELAKNREGNRINPSYVYYSLKGKLVGRMATEKTEEDSVNVFFDAKRLLAWNINSPKIQEFITTWPFEVIGYPNQRESKVHYSNTHNGIKSPIPPEEISKTVLESMLDDVCRRFDIKKKNVEAVITVPAYFNMAQKRTTMGAAVAAGINVKRILSEPVAAALIYQYELAGANKLTEGDYVFIFDLGGGTFDVTIMKIEDGIYKVIALGGDTHLGGRDFDRVLAEMIKGLLRQQLGNIEVNELMSQPKYRYRLMKIACEVKESFTITNTELVGLSDICNGVKDREITREDFERHSHQLQDRIKECCESTLRDAKIDPKDINHVLLVGGASKMKMVLNILGNIFPRGTDFSKTVSGEEAIARGATIYAAKISGVSVSPVIKNLKIQDALPLSIGIKVKGNKFKPILKNNSQIPSSNKIELRTSEDNQQTAVISIYEGLSENIENDIHIGHITVNGIPPKKAKEITIRLTLTLDDNGILQAMAEILGTNIVVRTSIDYQINFECNVTGNELSDIL